MIAAALSPVTVAAVMAGLVDTIALPAQKCPRADCNGGVTCWPTSETSYEEVGWCPDCTAGVVPLPDGPFPAVIGTTSETPRSGWLDDERRWRVVSFPPNSHVLTDDVGHNYVLPPSSAITGHMLCIALPIVDLTPVPHRPHVYLRSDLPRPTLFAWDDAYHAASGGVLPVEIQPWSEGLWVPGNYALRIHEVIPVTEPGGCPACLGSGATTAGRFVMKGGCNRCYGKGHLSAPLPWDAPDTPQLTTWEA